VPRCNFLEMHDSSLPDREAKLQPSALRGAGDWGERWSRPRAGVAGSSRTRLEGSSASWGVRRGQQLRPRISEPTRSKEPDQDRSSADSKDSSSLLPMRHPRSRQRRVRLHSLLLLQPASRLDRSRRRIRTSRPLTFIPQISLAFLGVRPLRPWRSEWTRSTFCLEMNGVVDSLPLTYSSALKTFSLKRRKLSAGDGSHL
jgi:hypothetical protein